jgi:uncharacterized protein
MGDKEINRSTELIESTISFVKQTLAHAEGGHDWWHIYRVWKLSKTIAGVEKKANMMVVELGALLHDIADSKFHDGDETIGPGLAFEFLKSQNVDNVIISQVLNIINNISFKNSFGNSTYNKSLELDIVQDADRLDAMGAIGIARTFNYGGFKNREIYNPTIKPETHLTKKQYKNSKSPTINHFYEKLLLLKNKMNTSTGKKIAIERHRFMEIYLNEFFDEWNGKK